MAVTTDADYLLHLMRVKFLRLEERGERILSFPPTAMSDDYIRMAAPKYPEMQYCYSPAYDLNAKDNALFASGLISTPRTKRTHYHRKKIQDDTPGNMDLSKPLPPATKSPPSGLASTLDEDLDAELDLRYHQTPLPPIPPPQQSMGKPIEEASILSQSTNQSEPVHVYLQPSMDSNVDPSPRSSLDVIDTNTQESSLPFQFNHESARSANLIYSPPAKQLTSLAPAGQPAFPLPLYLPQLPRTSQPQPPTLPITPSQRTPAAWFPMRPAYTVTHGQSALSALIAAKASKAENPFSAYSHASGKGSSRPMTLCVYLPHTPTPFKPESLVVRPDAIIDDVIGYILYDYVEQNRKPELQPELYDLAEWVLLIAEDDGEIEDDLPALDRTRRINQVSFDQFALSRATPAQAKQNDQIRAKMGRHKPDLDALKKKPSVGSALAMQPAPAANASNNSMPLDDLLDQPPATLLQPSPKQPQQALSVDHAPHSHSSSTGGDDTHLLDAVASNGTTNSLIHTPSTPMLQPAAAEPDSSAIAVPVPSSKAVLTKAALPMTPIKYFRIRLMTSEEVAATTTIPVYAEMFVGDVLELVSRKRKLDPNEYILTLPDSNLVVSNDTTVESLKSVEELTLTKKTSALQAPASSSNPLWRSPIKKKKDDHPPPMYFSSDDLDKQPSDTFLQQYKKYNVNRKTPMFVGKRVSTLVIDGNYIHLMPPEHKGMFDSVKTTSFHVNAVRSCKQSKKVPSNFKIGVMKERDFKTYELEAETAKEACTSSFNLNHVLLTPLFLLDEICARVRFLLQVNRGIKT
ncbi:SIN1-domain-containing protein [Hesseltinella vesiculosa]|uniref:SIN1-domain-containing protein n=1 Tax=Hesseltinella vesiculosa TaxID=101127 RepID=A0A1X2G8G4_9FUNG|nr:SIN1-domain-containing protein [Hesseltinella vesiculosa]